MSKNNWLIVALLTVMTEKLETDVNMDYIIRAVKIYAHITAWDAFQLKLQSFQSNNTDSNSLSLFSPFTETAHQWIGIIPMPARLCGYFNWYAAMFYTLINPNWVPIQRNT